MTRWYPMQPCDDTLAATAPIVLHRKIDIAAPPAHVWESLTSPQSVADWSRLIPAVEWTSERPFGIGTTRTVWGPLRAMQFHEDFFAWEEGRRYAFRGVEASLPLLDRMMEDYVLVPTPHGTRLEWTWALEGSVRAAPILGLTRRGLDLGFGRVGRAGRAYLERTYRQR